MKIKRRTLICQIAIVAFSLILSSSCKKENENPINQTNGRTTAVFNSNLTYGALTDQDGNVYKTITIGTQTWMAENLRTTKYRNGEKIPNVKDNDVWRELTTGAYCNYKNTSNIDTIATFGCLYNYFSIIDSRNVAPEGWHVPSDSEWTILITYLAGGDSAKGDTVAGAFLKEAGEIHWRFNPIADNRSGFTALPFGWRAGNGFGVDWAGANFWSSTEYSDTQTWIRHIFGGNSFVFRQNFGFKNLGFSIRCVKD